MKNKPNFGQKMRDIKLKKAKEQKDKELLERFPQVPPEESKIEQHLVLPIDPTSPVEARTILIKSQTTLERTIQTIREKSQGL